MKTCRYWKKSLLDVEMVKYYIIHTIELYVDLYEYHEEPNPSKMHTKLMKNYSIKEQQRETDRSIPMFTFALFVFISLLQSQCASIEKIGKYVEVLPRIGKIWSRVDIFWDSNNMSKKFLWWRKEWSSKC